MDLLRVRREVSEAQQVFSLVECHQSADGKLYVLAALQSTQSQIYTLAISLPDIYPNHLPTVHVRTPTLHPSPHRYPGGNICYLHPRMWNPGLHTLTFVIGRAAKWLAKYEVWLKTQRWPGAEAPH